MISMLFIVGCALATQSDILLYTGDQWYIGWIIIKKKPVPSSFSYVSFTNIMHMHLCVFLYVCVCHVLSVEEMKLKLYNVLNMGNASCS